MLIEIKGYPEPAPGIEAAVVKAVRETGMLGQVLAKSFFHDCVYWVRELAQEIATGILLASGTVHPVGTDRPRWAMGILRKRGTR